ncbi:hypothetical protein ACGFRG_00220 [Streptomyces sp. NPDC048696]|uniref:hypothetical protein n=1 Tax=Streptomyces sp. NPDC048696 TaxID=3365585 RepID=UPI00371E6942
MITYRSLRSTALAATVAVSALAIPLATASPASALIDLTRSLNLRNILNGPIQLNVLANVTNQGSLFGRTENFQATVAAGGVDIGAGTASIPVSNGFIGQETFTVPITLNAGHLANGEKVQVTVNDTETVNGIPDEDTAETRTLTCHSQQGGGILCE